MKISLRQAHDLQKRIDVRVGELVNDTENDLDIFFEDQPHIALDTQRDKNLTLIGRAEALIDAKATIRKQVSNLNDLNRVNDRLADIAALERKISIRSRTARTRPRADEATLDRKITASRDTIGNESQYSRDELDISVWTSNDVKHEKQLTRASEKRVRELKEEVLHTNVRIQLELDAATLSVLLDEEVV